MDLASFEAEAMAKVKQEDFDNDGYLLPGYVDQFVSTPPPSSSSHHLTGSFIVRNGYIFRPKEVMDEGFSFLESMFDRQCQELRHWVEHLRLMNMVSILAHNAGLIKHLVLAVWHLLFAVVFLSLLMIFCPRRQPNK